MAGEWFYDWFNSPYYHLLYNKRGKAEAELFINNLCGRLNPRAGSRVLDVACGRGRFSVSLNKHGYDVTGIDLSVRNIRYARRFKNDSLHFFVEDMRKLRYRSEFDMAFNLFTSFRYFKTGKEHIDSLINLRNALKPGGILVIDYFNSHKVIRNLIAEQTVTAGGIDFQIKKRANREWIIKTIAFTDKNESFTFYEMVRLFTTGDFKYLFDQSGFEIMTNFGSYGLDKFQTAQSERLIFICKRSDA